MFIPLFNNKNNLKILNNLRSRVVMNNFLANNKFIIFCNINKIQNFKILNLKIEIKKLKSLSLIANQKLIKLNNKILDFNFLGDHFLMISAPNFETLLKLIDILNNDNF
jgi:hypothetical protein